MGGAKKLHIGFPEKALDKYLPILTDNGFKVAVIEQTETPRMLEERLKKAKANNSYKVTKNDKVCGRAICNMVTKGTYKDVRATTEQTYSSKYVLSVKKHDNEIGVTFFDVNTLEIYIG